MGRDFWPDNIQAVFHIASIINPHYEAGSWANKRNQVLDKILQLVAASLVYARKEERC